MTQEPLTLRRRGPLRTICDAAGPLSVATVLHDLAEGHRIAEMLTDDLRADPSPGFFFECAPFSSDTLDLPLIYAVLDSHSVASLRANSGPFASKLVGPAPVHTFANLSGDALLVAPRALQPHHAWPHLATFLRGAPDAQISAFWQAAGEACLARLAERPGPLWLSTSGLGVYWLHLRLDSRPKYISHGPFRQWQRPQELR